MVNEMRENVKIEQVWDGYEISTVDPWCKVGRLYVFNVYNNQVRWVSDYAHAKHYSKRYAETLAKRIANGGVMV